MDRLLDTMRRLRAPDGCPWDREQTFESLRPYLLEEAAEATDALQWGSREDFVDELGDVLLQIAFYSVLGEEEQSFSYADIEEAIVSKMIRRHPHVFGDVKVTTSDEVRTNWLRIKEEEKQEQGRAGDSGESVPASLPVFMRISEAHDRLGLRASATEALPADSDAGSIAARIVDLALQAADEGIELELAVRDEISRRIGAAR